MDDNLGKKERGKRGLENLRDLLEEIAVVGMSESHVDIKIDAVHALEGLDHAEKAIQMFERGEWTHYDVSGTDDGCEEKQSTEDALADLRAAASPALRAASLDDVLTAAEQGMGRSPEISRKAVIEIEDEMWQLKPALYALADKELDVDDVLRAITSDSDDDGDEGFFAAIGAVAYGSESLPGAAERRGVDATEVAEALARYRVPEAWDDDGEDTKQRVYGAVLQAREPMSAAEIAERADCSEETAQTDLSFFAELGIVVPHKGRPVRYERNDDYFEWRRVNELSREHTVEELQARVSELTNRIEEYRGEYGADSPADLDVLEFDADRVEDVYVDLGEWATVIEERRLHERARRKVAGSTVSSHS